ncbi:hypothetical protein C4D60_Mb01t13430 [Musa balbisiana]|uniref:Uncharacterized protein n=1 Tax=Musa balbisiana TaxID=52838 RepID=A0A4S8JM96_MUSBA|nr:hypothetical protein C4D60_Mb01t13430 [Musa balbisiana]
MEGVPTMSRPRGTIHSCSLPGWKTALHHTRSATPRRMIRSRQAVAAIGIGRSILAAVAQAFPRPLGIFRRPDSIVSSVLGRVSMIGCVEL